ncbi:MAG: (2Fe-2S)-binding protein [Caldilineaceae bacterium]|nr:(2Fe-2S)-binding protein [Caldilineaceae bacterium]
MTTENPQLIVDGTPIEFTPGDSLLVALLRADRHPTGGGCLCLAGDCPHCLTTVDGVSYVRACQTPARPGLIVERHHAAGYPPLPLDAKPNQPDIPAHNHHCDVVVIGQGEAGQAAATAAQQAGHAVITLDAGAGQEVIGIYPGPLVVARTNAGMLHIHPRGEIVIATGATELQPIAPGNQLAGIVTARAATQLAAAGVALGRVVAVGAAPVGLDAQPVTGEIVRFEGNTKVEAVVVADSDGQEQRYPCDTVVVGLGLQPRDGLARMANGLPGIAIRTVGEAAVASPLPPCPKAGVVCACAGVTIADLEFIWGRGFHELELVKRATLFGTGTCQGAGCMPYVRSFLTQQGETLPAPFTARPVTRQLTLGEVAAGSYHQATPRTALDGEHRRLGAQMERVGGWWRPWHYGNGLEEYWAVRTAVSVGDVSTLGKLQVAGPDALEFLERLYPTKVATIKPGRARYVLLLDDRGYVLDDGLIARDGDSRFTLTFTSGGATTAELWLRDWADAWALDVRILNQTMALGAINVTGPFATALLRRAGLTNPPPYMGHLTATVANVPCKIFRLSFTGELSYELHHPAADSVRLWRRLLVLGREWGIKPHGIDTLLKLRLEKGHLIVGQDTDFDSTPRRLQHEWAVRMEKPDFVGKAALVRTNKLPLDRQLVGFTMATPAPLEGSVISYNDEYAGYVTSSFASPRLGKTVLLGWLRFFQGELPTTVTIEGRPAQRVAPPFYDPEGTRARA